MVCFFYALAPDARRFDELVDATHGDTCFKPAIGACRTAAPSKLCPPARPPVRCSHRLRCSATGLPPSSPSVFPLEPSWLLIFSQQRPTSCTFFQLREENSFWTTACYHARCQIRDRQSLVLRYLNPLTSLLIFSYHLTKGRRFRGWLLVSSIGEGQSCVRACDAWTHV